MQAGSIITGIITGIKEYGAFVQAGEYSGLIHISEFSDDYVKNINDIVDIGAQVSVYVLEVDEEGKKLKLSFKKANVLPSKLLERVRIYKGFNGLALRLDEWTNTKYEEIINKGNDKK